MHKGAVREEVVQIFRIDSTKRTLTRITSTYFEQFIVRKQNEVQYSETTKHTFRLQQDKEYGENSTKYFLEFRKEKLHQETHKKALIQRQGA